MMPLAVQAAMAAIEKICPEAKNLLLIPENARDTFYLSNLATLQKIFSQAGLSVRLGSLSNDVTEPDRDRTARRRDRHAGALAPQQAPPRAEELRPLHHPAQQRSLRRRAGHPGRPARAVPAAAAARGLEHAPQEHALQGLRGSRQALRQAAGHGPVAHHPMFTQCGSVDFAASAGLECLRSNTDALLTKIRRKYKEYGINEKPFVVVKADNGTGGMGIMTVRDVKDIDALTPAAKVRMATAQGGRAVTEVIIQEGVLTNERINARWPSRWST
jgi:glutamate--cysteine ligase